MNFQERSYSTQSFRPKPLLVQGENPSSLIVISSWGGKDEAERVAKIFTDQMQAEELTDFTTPFGRIESLSAKANQMRTAAMLANDFLYREANKTEFMTSVEVLGVVFERNVLSWVQVGSPHLLLVQSGLAQPLAYNLDWSWQMNQVSPMPINALGMQASTHINCGSLVMKSDADLLLVGRGAIPTGAFQTEHLDMLSLSRIFVEENSEIPFWLGHLEISSSRT